MAYFYFTKHLSECSSYSLQIDLFHLLISPVLIVMLNDEHTLTHSGGGASVQVFVPTICACHDGLPT